MKIDINLTWSETQGIKKYLSEVYEIERPTKEDVKEFIQNVIIGAIHSERESVNDYIKQFEPNETDI